ncbi:MAG: hypothetical protein Crog4KO_01680 [Crocinitomicaceae bacterium]
MEDYDKIYIGFLFSIIGIVSGWGLNQLSQWFRVRKDDKRKVKRVLFNLLETYFLFQRSDTDKYFNYYKETVLSKVPGGFQSEVKAQLESAIDLNLVPNLVTPELIEESKTVRVSYEESVNSLSEIDPILAYYLSGRTNVLERFEKLGSWLESMSSEEENEEEFNQGVNMVLNIAKPDLIAESLDDLRADVLKVARKINPIVWLKARKALKHLDNNSEETMKKQINAFVDKMIAEMQG